MPRQRRVENKELPLRWRFYHGAYFYRVPPGMERYWDFRREFRLGSSFDEAKKVFDKRMASLAAADDIPSTKILSKREILASSMSAPLSGVYFLISGKDVVYVGRSDNILSRVGSHASGEIEFDSLFWIPVAGIDQFRMEQIYIAKLRPKYNIRLVRNGTSQIYGTEANNLTKEA